MPYHLISADETLERKNNGPVVFLGGSCRGRDWRLEMQHKFDSIDITFINPKRKMFIDPELDPLGHAKQIEWERQALEFCDVALFWLGEGLTNQASRVEMGFAIGAQKMTLIGADETFLGREHLSAFGGLVLSQSIEGLMNRLASWVEHEFTPKALENKE